MFAPPPQDIKIEKKLIETEPTVPTAPFNEEVRTSSQDISLRGPYQRQISGQSITGSRKTILSEVDTAVIRKPTAAWGSPLEFVLTCISYAVGLGNVWRFPYLCYKNGGGAFLIPYCIMLFLLGIPVFFLELSFGQFPSMGPLMVWQINPFFKGLGYAMVAVCILIPLYYTIIIAQCALFFFMSIRDVLPWDSCGNSWNTPECTEPQHSLNGSSPIMNATDILKTNYTAAGTYALVGTKTEEFYYNFILNQSPDGIDDMGLPHWPLALCLLFSWTVVALGLIKGVKSLGKISYFTALFPYVMLTILLVRSCMLDGAVDGIIYYLTPNWNRLKEVTVWQEAATQIFYSLGCATGCLQAMASYNKFKNNCLRDTMIVSLLNALTSLFAGAVVFSVLGFMAYSKNTTVDKVASDGPGLVFIVYPEALTKLPVSPLWSVLFFLMMLTLGFGSVLSNVETFLTAFQDEFHEVINNKWRRIGYRVAVCVVCFFLGLPMVCRGGIYLLQLIDFFVAFIAMLVICFLELIVLAWIYGHPKFLFLHDIEMMLGKKPPVIFRFMWRYITPVALFVIIVASCALYSTPKMSIGGIDVPYPSWAIVLGWLTAVFPIAIIPAWMTYYHCYLGGYDLLRDHTKPMVNWGPRNPEDRTGRFANQTEAILAAQQLSASQSQLSGIHISQSQSQLSPIKEQETPMLERMPLEDDVKRK